MVKVLLLFFKENENKTMLICEDDRQKEMMILEKQKTKLKKEIKE